ncbi:hypothetical protein F5146DRAFT_1133637 [Armillaria mellea]|nr:hypothetical protein F5146DRAFT_1133637 [Armillaria mellea]
MASTDAIDQLASNLTAKILCDSNVIDLRAEVEVLITAIKQLIRTQQKFLADAHEQRRRAVTRMLPLVDSLSVKHINIRRRRILEQVRQVAEAHCESIQGHVTRLWAALMPGWKSVQDQLTCPICFRKLWQASILVPCGDTVCTACTYEWFQIIKDTDENPHFMCVVCGSAILCRPLRARMIENVVKGLPDADDGERVYCEEAARRCGYLGEESWDDILN